MQSLPHKMVATPVDIVTASWLMSAGGLSPLHHWRTYLMHYICLACHRHQTPDSRIPQNVSVVLIKYHSLRCCVSFFFPFLISNAVSKTKLPWGRNVLVKPLNLFFFHLSGDNLPEEHCKYTKQSLPSPRLCLSHITQPLLAHHTYCVVQRICFFAMCIVLSS